MSHGYGRLFAAVRRPRLLLVHQRDEVAVRRHVPQGLHPDESPQFLLHGLSPPGHAGCAARASVPLPELEPQPTTTARRPTQNRALRTRKSSGKLQQLSSHGSVAISPWRRGRQNHPRLVRKRDQTIWRRVLLVDALECPRCHGRMRIVAAATDPPAVERIHTSSEIRWQRERSGQRPRQTRAFSTSAPTPSPWPPSTPATSSRRPRSPRASPPRTPPPLPGVARR